MYGNNAQGSIFPAGTAAMGGVSTYRGSRAEPAGRKRINGIKKKVNPLPLLFTAPAAILIIFVYAVPFVFSILASLTDWTGIGFNWHFIGMRNYFDLFHEKRMEQVLLNNIKYLFFLVIVQNILSVFLALLLNKSFRLRNMFRTILFMPTCIATIAVGFIWSLMFDPVNGPLPLLSKYFRIPAISGFTWLGDSVNAIYLVIFVSMWQWVAWNMIIYLAGLQNVPQELLQAAEIDGAGPAACFAHVIIPSLRPAITVNLILSAISVLKFFDLPYVMTKGGPGYSTETIAITTYSYTFLYNKLGYGTAISLVMFLVILLITVFQLFILKRNEGDLPG
ncbi:MAG: sugar ABC transporter permease [Treponema sp.]|nr:sugar ABC transporter permease [Treponema sp.]